MIKACVLLFLFLSNTFAIAQVTPVYNFQKDDPVLKKKYVEEASQQQKILINNLANEYKRDFIRVYDNRYKEVETLLQSSRVVTSSEPFNYLNAILKRIVDGNKELKGIKIRMVFSRDRWPNAYSMGEGTIVINAGLMPFLDNEAELVFVLCHELAHYYLDHGNNAIKKNIERINSDEYKKEIRRLSKKEYRVNEQLDSLVKKINFGNRRHSREFEAEADRKAFEFMKKTGYDLNAIKTCLQMLEKVDDSRLYNPLNLEQAFDFKDYPFKKRWIKNESVLFDQVDSDLTLKEKDDQDSLKTHPDCEMRIALLKDSIITLNNAQKFLENESYFKQLKKDFLVEMLEQDYRDENLTRNLYYSLVMLQNGENIPMAIYSVTRVLNKIYDNQENHQIAKTMEKESKHFSDDYNLLLRMFDRLKLEELANLNHHFCKHYEAQMEGYEGFLNEMERANKNVK